MSDTATRPCMLCDDHMAVWVVTDHDGDDITLCAEHWAELAPTSDLDPRPIRADT